MGFTVEHYEENARTSELREYNITIRATGHDRLAHILSDALAVYLRMVSAIDETFVSPELYSRGDFMQSNRKKRVRQVVAREISQQNPGLHPSLDEITVGWDSHGIYAAYKEQGNCVDD
ncbi:MAG: hypothetical protein AABX37_00615 [Nanoarchaeota archaeon]